MRRKGIMYWAAALLALILTCAAVLAAPAGSIRVTVTDETDDPVPGMTVTLYRVVDETGALNPDFRKAALTAAEIRNHPHDPDHAKKLAQCAGKYQLTGESKVTNSGGVVNFTGLSEGVYLVLGERNGVEFDPFTVPMPTVINGVSDYSVEADPKVEELDPPPSSTPGVTPTPTPTPGTSDDPDVTPTPGTSDDPDVTPTPGTSDDPDVTPTPGTSDDPGVTPTPGPSDDPGGKLPQSGANVLPVYLLGAAGGLCILLGLIELLRGRRERHE